MVAASGALATAIEIAANLSDIIEFIQQLLLSASAGDLDARAEVVPRLDELRARADELEAELSRYRPPPASSSGSEGELEMNG